MPSAPRTLTAHLRRGARLKLTEPWPDRPAPDSVDVRLTVAAPGGARDTATASARFVPWPAVAGTGMTPLTTAAAATAAATVALITARHRRRRALPAGRAPGATTGGETGATSGGGRGGAAAERPYSPRGPAEGAVT